MIRRPIFSALAACALAVTLAFPRAAGCEPRALADSTVLDIWQLPNGLRVVVRHISTAGNVAIALAWPTGSDFDPPGLTGRAALLAELEMMGAAGDTPERSRDEMNTLRPLGWGAAVSPRVTQLTEIATRDQFPGTLHQVAQRLRGVTVTDSLMSRSLQSLRVDLQQQRSPTSNAELYVATRELARGAYEPAAGEAGLRALSRLKAAELQTLLSRTFIPSGTVLSLAGNLGDMNLPALIGNEFGGIPAGPRLPEPALPVEKRGTRDLTRPGLAGPVGALAIIAPALDDSLHPSFFLSMLFLGGFCQKEWRTPMAPLTSRFQYSIFDDPELVRFYPPPGAGTAADSALDVTFNELVSRMGAMMFPLESYESVLRGVSWLLGAPLPPEMLARAGRDPNLLGVLASNQAVRELWGGEPFWTEYRRRLVPGRKQEFYSWVSYLLDQQHRVKVVLHPRR